MAGELRFTADELVLMLGFVLGDQPGGAQTVPELSGLLRSLPGNVQHADDPTFRSVLGLRTSLRYMREIDVAEGDWPPADEDGRRRNWRPHFKAVWQTFGRDPDGRRARVVAILDVPDAAGEVEEPDFDEGFVEGRAFFGLHRRRERSSAAVERKKRPPAVCEVCGFDFEKQYGAHGRGFIECHHIQPLADVDVALTRMEDLALVCANCHRMLHRGTPPPTPDQLRDMLAP